MALLEGKRAMTLLPKGVKVHLAHGHTQGPGRPPISSTSIPGAERSTIAGVHDGADSAAAGRFRIGNLAVGVGSRSAAATQACEKWSPTAPLKKLPVS